MCITIEFLEDMTVDIGGDPSKRLECVRFNDGETLRGRPVAHVVESIHGPIEAFDLELAGGETILNIPYSCVELH